MSSMKFYDSKGNEVGTITFTGFGVDFGPSVKQEESSEDDSYFSSCGDCGDCGAACSDCGWDGECGGREICDPSSDCANLHDVGVSIGDDGSCDCADAPNCSGEVVSTKRTDHVFHCLSDEDSCTSGEKCCKVKSSCAQEASALEDRKDLEDLLKYAKHFMSDKQIEEIVDRKKIHSSSEDELTKNLKIYSPPLSTSVRELRIAKMDKIIKEALVAKFGKNKAKEKLKDPSFIESPSKYLVEHRFNSEYISYRVRNFIKNILDQGSLVEQLEQPTKQPTPEELEKQDREALSYFESFIESPVSYRIRIRNFIKNLFDKG